MTSQSAMRRANQQEREALKLEYHCADLVGASCGEESSDGYVCTRDALHDGIHVAHAGGWGPKAYPLGYWVRSIT